METLSSCHRGDTAATTRTVNSQGKVITGHTNLADCTGCETRFHRGAGRMLSKRTFRKLESTNGVIWWHRVHSETQICSVEILVVFLHHFFLLYFDTLQLTNYTEKT